MNRGDAHLRGGIDRVFANVLDFRADWSESHPAAKYRDYDAPDEFDLDWLPSFKREVYREVMHDFFGVSI